MTAKTVIPGTDCALPGTACLAGAALDTAGGSSRARLFQPTGDWTATDVYDGSRRSTPTAPTRARCFGEIGVAADSTKPLVSPTEIIDAQATGR